MTPTLSLDDILAQLLPMHRHICPRQVLGVRIGMCAAELLGLYLPQEDKRLLAFVETDGCFADGVAVATGCWMGHRTMRLIDYGKVAATFVDTRTNQAVRIAPSPHARAAAAQALPHAKSRWHAQRDAYQTLPDSVLLCATPVEVTLPLAQIIARPGVRVSCDTCGEEIINSREVLRGAQTLCQSCAGETYYRDVVREAIA
ncbi:formylmethanofuran dehydrogenase [Chloroflexia bacterium SDU3-3]|nr:formylmethanofuran dehydrogenase [Chloroflexia bacterium SDU3-3]